MGSDAPRRALALQNLAEVPRVAADRVSGPILRPVFFVLLNPGFDGLIEMLGSAIHPDVAFTVL